MGQASLRTDSGKTAHPIDLPDQTMTNDKNAPNDGFSAEPKTDRMFQLAYVSTQTQPLNARELLGLLEEARVANNERGLTGILLHKERSFFQVLEGPEDEVKRVFNSIAKDKRHDQIEVLVQSELSEREYPDWRMGFVDLDGIDPRLLEGYTDFMAHTEEPREFLAQLSKGARLALMFRKLA
jgi:hypothetical protein